MASLLLDNERPPRWADRLTKSEAAGVTRTEGVLYYLWLAVERAA